VILRKGSLPPSLSSCLCLSACSLLLDTHQTDSHACFLYLFLESQWNLTRSSPRPLNLHETSSLLSWEGGLIVGFCCLYPSNSNTHSNCLGHRALQQLGELSLPPPTNIVQRNKWPGYGILPGHRFCFLGARVKAKAMYCISNLSQWGHFFSDQHIRFHVYVFVE
jgi:hypothetical protein